MSDNGKLSAKQEQAIPALLSELTITEAAKKVGVTDRTLYRWLDDDDFNEAYRKARRKAVQKAISRIQHFSWAAVQVLAEVMADRRTTAGVRVRAACALLEFAIKAIELEDHEERIAALEAYAKQTQTN